MTWGTKSKVVIFGIGTFFFPETNRIAHDNISTFDLIKSPYLRAIDSMLFLMFIYS